MLAPTPPNSLFSFRALSIMSLICSALSIGIHILFVIPRGAGLLQPGRGEALLPFELLLLLGALVLGILSVIFGTVDLSLAIRFHKTAPKYLARFRRDALIWLGAVALFGINFAFFLDEMKASPRSPVARVRGDQRTLTIGLETYYLDHNAYPAWTAASTRNLFSGIKGKPGILKRLPTFLQQGDSVGATLTTPIAYITSYFTDPFAPDDKMTFCYWTPDPDAAPLATRDGVTTHGFGIGYILWSPGPDGAYDLTLDNIAKAYAPAETVPNSYLIDRTYDPSNGTESRGDVYRVKQ